MKEETCDLPIKKPCVYKFSSLGETISFATTLSAQEEGFVVVDGDWHRVKIKRDAYIQLHHMRGEAVTSKRVLALILLNEVGEFLNYFPEYKGMCTELTIKLSRYIDTLITQLNEMEILKNQVLKGEKTRKDYAEQASKTINRTLMFDFFSNKFMKNDVLQYIRQKYTVDKLIDWLDNMS